MKVSGGAHFKDSASAGLGKKFFDSSKNKLDNLKLLMYGE